MSDEVDRVFISQHDSITVGGTIYRRGYVSNPPVELVRMARDREMITSPLTGKPERRVMFADEVDQDTLTRVFGDSPTTMAGPPAGTGDVPESARRESDRKEEEYLPGDQLL